MVGSLGRVVICVLWPEFQLNEFDPSLEFDLIGETDLFWSTVGRLKMAGGRDLEGILEQIGSRI